MINYEEIVENLELDGIKHLLEDLDIPFRETDTALIMPTVCHNDNIDEASWKLYYYKNTHIFYCFTECGALSIFKFLKQFYEIRQIAYDWYNDILKVILNCSASDVTNNHITVYKSHKDEYTPQKNRQSLPIFSKGLMDIFIHQYPIEWLNDSISQKTMDKYNIRYSISQNKIIIPHYNADGDLVGIRGRALNPEEVEHLGKYMPIQIENKWYSHPLSLNLYGLYENKENIIKRGIVFICESEKSVLQAESFSFPNCAVASCGSNLNKYQIDLLIRTCHPREIVICYDREELDGQDIYFNKLYNMCKKYIRYCNMSFIYDREKITKLKDSPTDNGEEIFLKLLKERVKVK